MRDQIGRVAALGNASHVVVVHPQIAVDTVEIDLKPSEVRGLDLGAAVIRGHRDPLALSQPERLQRQPHCAAAEMRRHEPRVAERERSPRSTAHERTRL